MVERQKQRATEVSQLVSIDFGEEPRSSITYIDFGGELGY